MPSELAVDWGLDPRAVFLNHGSFGAFVGADPDDPAFVANATGAVNAVLRSRTTPRSTSCATSPRATAPG